MDSKQMSITNLWTAFKRNKAADIAGGILIATVIVLLVTGLGWSYNALGKQAKMIDTLTMVTANGPQVINANKLVQLYGDFLMLTVVVNDGETGSVPYNDSYSGLNPYAGSAIRPSHAQVALLADNLR